MYTEQYHILEGTIWTQILILLGSHMDTFLRSFGVFLLVKCCGSFNKFNTYFLRSLNSRLFFRLWIFYMVRQRGTHFCRLFYWSVRYPVTPITQIRDQLGNLTAKRTQQVSFDLLILIQLTVNQFNCVRRSNAPNKTDLLDSQGSSCYIILFTANSKLPSPYLNNNRISLQRVRVSRNSIGKQVFFDLLPKLKIFYYSQVLHVLGECSILATSE